MTGALIFKMELFKFIREKKYILAIATLGLLNTVVTLFYTLLLTSATHFAFDSVLIRFASIMNVVTVILLLANAIFLFLFPFHVLSIDYKNNVMAMMIASGVNRSKLFFSKIGAVILLSISVFLLVAGGPLLVYLIQSVIGGQINDFFDSVMGFIKLINLNINALTLLFTGLLSVLNNVVLITAATILMKGRNMSILVAIGFTLLSSFLTGLFNTFAFQADIGMNAVPMVQGFSAVLSIAIFIFIGLYALQHQNL